MRRLALIIIIITLGSPIHSQNYEFTFKITKDVAQTLYIGKYYKDSYIAIDSTTGDKGTYTFKGKQKWNKGVYGLFEKGAKKSVVDFTVDDSFKFTIEYDSTFNHTFTRIKGSTANKKMYEYIATLTKARAESREIEKMKKSSNEATRAEAAQKSELLQKRMEKYEDSVFEANSKYFFFNNLQKFKSPDVPDSLSQNDKAVYYREHYWDNIDLTDHSLVYTQDLFNKMNYYFFGLLYHAEFDTIAKYGDKVLSKVENDTLMLRYFLDFIMPKYYRSTKNIGWDQVWCHFVRKYYLTGKCTWASDGEIYNKKQTVEFLEQSLIGAKGAELYMADSNQSRDPQQWISSHRFPQKYVILWFWDPDCHHCKAYTKELIALYDSHTQTGNRNFEVYAIGYEADVTKWKNHLIKNPLPFVNVGGSNVNIDYQEAYNVHGAPTMIILNADREIIMNKTIPIKSIPKFLSDYENRHPEQKNRGLSQWQKEGVRLWGASGYHATDNPTPKR